MVLRLKYWDDLTAPADTVVMAIDKKSNPNQVETLSLTEVPPVSLSIWGKDRICTPLARVGATKPTWPFLLTAIVLLMCLQPSHCNHLRVGLPTLSLTVGCPMTILGHPTHSDAPVHLCWDILGTSHSKCCPAQKTANKNRSWCDELKRVTLVPTRKHVFLSSLRQLSKLLIRATPLSRGAHPSHVPLATSPTPSVEVWLWHFLGWVAHASVWSSNCLSGTCDRSAAVWVRPILGGSQRQFKFGFQLSTVLVAPNCMSCWISKQRKDIQVTKCLTLSLSWPGGNKAKRVAKEAPAVSQGCLQLRLLYQWKSETACARVNGAHESLWHVESQLQQLRNLLCPKKVQRREEGGAPRFQQRQCPKKNVTVYIGRNTWKHNATWNDFDLAWKVRGPRWIFKNQVNICMFVTFKVLVSGRGNKRNSDTQMVLRLKYWDDLTAPADTVVMAIDKKSNSNQLETLSLTEVPPVSLSIWGKDGICTPLAQVGATRPTWPFCCWRQ